MSLPSIPSFVLSGLLLLCLPFSSFASATTSHISFSYAARQRMQNRARLLKQYQTHLKKQASYIVEGNAESRRALRQHNREQQLGKPYVWGGTRPDQGFDCSGLVFYAYNKILEAKLPRTANEMYHYRRATIVANNDLRRGDLLFFHIHSREIADHMGVYLGDGQFIESPRTGETIRISRLAEPFWQDHFLGARRILTEETIL
ncbi:C40 family peptidase [Escherichia coli]|uniref:C40 family peptidase n=1 Tax=Escherichia coli TaxID=562 RepID=UPI002892F6FD|nr:C40 family peptidase [Escherichia coli]